MISIILLLAIGLLCLAVVSLGLAIVSLRLVVRLRRLETQLRQLEQRPEPAKRTVEISRPDRMAWFLARAGWSPAEIADLLNLPLAQIEGWTRDGREDV